MIAIPNIKKPESCYNHCLEGFIANEEIGCPLKDYAESHQYKDRIHTDCPLIEIVKCKDCNRSATDDGGNTYCLWLGALRKPTDFCSYGERKGTGVKEAITQLEIIATNMVGRLCEISNEDERQIAILNKQIEALDMGIDALKRLGE